MSNPSQQQLQEANQLNDVSMITAGVSLTLTAAAAASASTGIGLVAVPFIEAAVGVSDLISATTGIASSSIELEEALHTHNKTLEIESAVGIGLNALQLLLPFVPEISSLGKSLKVSEDAEKAADDAAKSWSTFMIKKADKLTRPLSKILEAGTDEFRQGAYQIKRTLPEIITTLKHASARDAVASARDAVRAVKTVLVIQVARIGIDAARIAESEYHRLVK